MGKSGFTNNLIYPIVYIYIYIYILLAFCFVVLVYSIVVIPQIPNCKLPL